MQIEGKIYNKRVYLYVNFWGGHMSWFMGSQFSEQGLNPGPWQKKC